MANQVIYMPEDTRWKDLGGQIQQGVLQGIQLGMKKKEQERKEAQFQIQTLMETGGTLDDATMTKLSKAAGMSEGWLKSLSQKEMTPSLDNKGEPYKVDADQFDKMFNAGGTNMKSTGTFASSQERALQAIKPEMQARAEGTAAVAPILREVKVEDENAMTPGMAKRAKLMEKAKTEADVEMAPQTTKAEAARVKAVKKAGVEADIEMAPEVRKKLADDFKSQAQSVEEVAAMYFKPQLARKLEEHEKMEGIDHKFKAALKRIPQAETAAHEEMTRAHAEYFRKNSEFIANGGKDKTNSSQKYADVIKMAEAAGLVETNAKTKSKVIKDVKPGSKEEESLKAMFDEAGLEYEEITVPHWYGLGKAGVRIVPIVKPNKSTSSSTSSSSGGKSDAILERKVVDGKKLIRKADGWYEE
jgi:hypothetical protein